MTLLDFGMTTFLIQNDGQFVGRKQIAVALVVAAVPLLSVAKQCKGFALEPRT